MKTKLREEIEQLENFNNHWSDNRQEFISNTGQTQHVSGGLVCLLREEREREMREREIDVKLLTSAADDSPSV